MAEGSSEEHKHPISPAVTYRFTGFSAIPVFHAALQPKWPRGWTGLTGYSDSTPLALSNDTNSFGVIEKKYRENSDRVFSTDRETAWIRLPTYVTWPVQPPLGRMAGNNVRDVIIAHVISADAQIIESVDSM